MVISGERKQRSSMHACQERVDRGGGDTGIRGAGHGGKGGGERMREGGGRGKRGRG